MKRILVAVTTLFLAACTSHSIGQTALPPDGCADKAALSLVSSTPVPGTFACMDSAKQARLIQGGVHNDADLAANPVTLTINGTPIPLLATPCGPMTQDKDAGVLGKNQKFYDIHPADTTLSQSADNHEVIQIITNRSDTKVDRMVLYGPTCPASTA